MKSINRPSWFPKIVWNFLFTYKDEYKAPVVVDEWKIVESSYQPESVKTLPDIKGFSNLGPNKIQSTYRPSRSKDYAKKSIVQTTPRKVREETHIDYSRSDSSNDLVTGMIIGSLMNSQNNRQEEISTQEFKSGNGGDFGGGGASGSWDNEPTKIETCSYSSSSYSSSSDSSSSDSSSSDSSSSDSSSY